MATSIGTRLSIMVLTMSSLHFSRCCTPSDGCDMMYAVLAQEKVLVLTKENNMLMGKVREAASKEVEAAQTMHELQCKLAHQQGITDAVQGEARSPKETCQSMPLELENRVRPGLRRSCTSRVQCPI
jgi:hypothetical protein